MLEHWINQNVKYITTSTSVIIRIIHLLTHVYVFSMLKHKFFHRAKKVPVSEELLKLKKKKDVSKSSDDKEKKTEKEKKEEEVAESSQAEGKGQEVRF